MVIFSNVGEKLFRKGDDAKINNETEGARKPHLVANWLKKKHYDVNVEMVHHSTRFYEPSIILTKYSSVKQYVVLWIFLNWIVK